MTCQGLPDDVPGGRGCRNTATMVGIPRPASAFTSPMYLCPLCVALSIISLDPYFEFLPMQITPVACVIRPVAPIPRLFPSISELMSALEDM